MHGIFWRLDVRLSRPARDDLQQVYLTGVDLFGSRQADVYIDGLLAALDVIADFPRAGLARPEFGPTSRSMTYKSHVVLYRLDGDDVFVRRIRHGLEDWQWASPDVEERS